MNTELAWARAINETWPMSIFAQMDTPTLLVIMAVLSLLVSRAAYHAAYGLKNRKR